MAPRRTITTKTRKLSAKVKPPVIKLPSRQIKPVTQLMLFVRAGGRCEFDGCNAYLLEHPLTLTRGNFAQMAHVVAFKKDGPRGSGLRPKDINDVSNLMLLCPSCHKLIDAHPETHPVSVLERYKEKHEERIKHVTGLGSDLKTSVVQLKAKIAGHIVAIPASQVTSAVAPRYPVAIPGHIIDVTGIEAEGKAFLDAAAETIKRRVEIICASGTEIHESRHISLFALAPIPLLVYLGRELGNKVAIDVFQRHRDTEDWAWKESSTPIRYRVEKRLDGNERTKVALVLSLSGRVHLQSLPREIDHRFTVYELTLDGTEPTPTYLRLREDLQRFGHSYQALLRQILRDHGQIKELHLFPAIPAPVAVLCGREVLPKVDPTLLVYDYDKRNNGFNLAMEVN
jgi:hypothetical protein